MSDVANASTPGPNPQPRTRSRRATWIVVTAIAAGLTLGAATTMAFSHGPLSPASWHRGWHGGGFMGGPLTPAQIEERADRAIRHLAIEVDATTEQQDKLRAIVKSAVGDIMPMREKSRAGRAQARKLLTEPTVNRAEIERLRADQIALADAFSRRIAQALGDAGEVLTVEQRKKIDDFLPPPGVPGPRRGWFR